jgi:hypothetical protein
MGGLSNNERASLKRVLKYEYQYSNTSWRLKDENFIGLVQSVFSVLNRFDKIPLPNNIEVLKGKKGDRIVFRIKLSSQNSESFVVKMCPFVLFKHRLRYTWMIKSGRGVGEAENLVIAAERGIPVPNVYGCGYVYDSFRLINMRIIILEDLLQYGSVDQCLQVDHPGEQQVAVILKRTIPVFVDLYRAKCNNIEINPHAIMLSKNGSVPDSIVLDFEDAKFYNKPSLEILMFEAASLVKWSPQRFTETAIMDWLNELLVSVGIDDVGIRTQLQKRFHYYRAAKLHRKHRMKIQ